MLINLLTKNIRKFLAGKEQKFVFVKPRKLIIPKLKEIDLYIHIPFCKSLCPYCPYNKVKYDEKLVRPFLDAILKEINLYYEKLGRIKISSIYIGGGTPTNLLNELGVILEEINKKFIVVGNICIETSPADINDEVAIKLREYGVDLVSLGVQSFQDKFLKLLGRNYQSKDIKPAINILKKYNFKSINIDLMFVLPSQTHEDIIFELKEILNMDVNQVTLYPLFTFPYSSVGTYKNLKRIKMPKIYERRKMYKQINHFLLKNNFNRVSVWGFKKGNAPRYSSVTRDYYIGLGPGAGSRLPQLFYFNTFSVNEYAKSLFKKNELPISLKMDILSSLAKYYWIYWRLYDTYIPKKGIKDIFCEQDKKVKFFLFLAKLLSFCRENKEGFELTEKGAFWIHLSQNYFVLNYINKVWSVSMEEAWPKKIEI
jgi:oxygen-independent coproporphyrinogen-3 oxidase